ncbi:MFS transporter [Hyunsoonleella sp. SJ7]|uniref:MFS transporter n=1 Tax=Hyunsoonleella aquatilis TaxID=2762758 RepID=A0A923HCZ9_9FLAO|nr:MFS transporter [Hyunsoonleella aquatilis]MBC3759194.1 MFS transporter [Hyunsoonleella aquatilis]
MNKYTRNAFLYALIVAIGSFVFGLDAVLISGGFKFITQEFNLTASQVGLIGSGPGIGVLIALPLTAYSATKLGRKLTLQIIAVFYIVSAVGSALAPSFLSLFWFRFLGGLAFSSVTLASMYIGEVAPAEQRGKLVSTLQINMGIGFTAAYLINYWILQKMGSDAQWVQDLNLAETGWRWMLAIEIVPAVIWFLLLYMIPKSPAWLVYKGRVDDAKKSLSKVYPEDKVEQQVQEMIESVEDSDTSSSSTMGQFKEIFSSKMRIVLIIAFTLAVVQQFTGMNAVMIYAPTMFEQLGLGTDAAFSSTIWIGVIGLVSTLISLSLIDRFGRRPLVLGGLVVIILSIATVSYGFKQATYKVTQDAIVQMKDIPDIDKLGVIVGKEFDSDIVFKNTLAEILGVESARDNSGVIFKETAHMNAMLILLSILTFIAAFNFSIGPIMWVLLSEIFPISNRGVAIPLFALISSTVSALVQFLFPLEMEHFGATITFIIYAAIVLVGVIILYKYLVETKGLSLEEIQAKLQRK